MQASARDPAIAVLEDDNGKNFCPLLCAPLVCRGVFRLLFSFLSCHRDSYSWILFGLSGFWRLEHLSPKERLFFSAWKKMQSHIQSIQNYQCPDVRGSSWRPNFQLTMSCINVSCLSSVAGVITVRHLRIVYRTSSSQADKGKRRQGLVHVRRSCVLDCAFRRI